MKMGLWKAWRSGRRALVWTFFLLLLAAACGPDTPLPMGSTGLSPEVALAPKAAPHEEPMPAALRAATIASVQAGASEAYRVAQDEGDLRADNPAQRLGIGFSAAGVELSRRDAAEGAEWSLSLRAESFGCEGDERPLPGVEPSAAENRVTYERDGLTERYVNGALGLEQVFTLPAPPPCNSTGSAQKIAIAIRLESKLAARLVDDSDVVELRDSADAVALRVTDLYVTDATGKELASRFELRQNTLRIAIDTEGASYPLHVDPLIATQQGTLLAEGGAADDRFGVSVAIAGDTAVVGAYLDDDEGTDSGSAYVFVRSGSTWTEQAKLLPTDGATEDYFGLSVAIAGDTVVAGAKFDDDNGSFSGSAYVFVRSGATWSQQAKLLPEDAEAGDHFGQSVAILGDTAVLGAFGDSDNGSISGSAYVFVRSDGTWTQQAKLLPEDGAAYDHFGLSVAIAGDAVVVGAYADDTEETDSGSAYVFARSGATWTQQGGDPPWVQFERGAGTGRAL